MLARRCLTAALYWTAEQAAHHRIMQHGHAEHDGPAYQPAGALYLQRLLSRQLQQRCTQCKKASMFQFLFNVPVTALYPRPAGQSCLRLAPPKAMAACSGSAQRAAIAWLDTAFIPVWGRPLHVHWVCYSRQVSDAEVDHKLPSS